MKRFNIDESPDIVVNITFNTTVLRDGNGGEERNINWQSPLLSYDLQKVILHRKQLDEIIQFFNDVRGAAIPFLYRDWSDYLVTARPNTSKYGSTTQGLLLPLADGIQTQFGIVKRYTIPSCTHYRAIAHPDPETITVYNASFNPFPDTDWIFADGKIIFTTPPPAGQLYLEGEFDVAVTFENDEYQYKIKTAKNAQTYSIEGLQLKEVRSRGEQPFAPTDVLEEIDTPFALSGHFNSLVGISEQTEIITLASGFDKRTSRYTKGKGTYYLGKIPLHDQELEYLISLFRCTKGRGLSWALGDVGYQLKHVPVRFDEDNLSLRLNKQGRYEVDGLKAIEVSEPLPIKVRAGLPPGTFVNYEIPDTGIGINSGIPAGGGFQYGGSTSLPGGSLKPTIFRGASLLPNSQTGQSSSLVEYYGENNAEIIKYLSQVVSFSMELEDVSNPKFGAVTSNNRSYLIFDKKQDLESGIYPDVTGSGFGISFYGSIIAFAMYEKSSSNNINPIQNVNTGRFASRNEGLIGLGFGEIYVYGDLGIADFQGFSRNSYDREFGGRYLAENTANYVAGISGYHGSTKMVNTYSIGDLPSCSTNPPDRNGSSQQSATYTATYKIIDDIKVTEGIVIQGSHFKIAPFSRTNYQTDQNRRADYQFSSSASVGCRNGVTKELKSDFQFLGVSDSFSENGTRLIKACYPYATSANSFRSNDFTETTTYTANASASVGSSPLVSKLDPYNPNPSIFQGGNDLIFHREIVSNRNNINRYTTYLAKDFALIGQYDDSSTTKIEINPVSTFPYAWEVKFAFDTSGGYSPYATALAQITANTNNTETTYIGDKRRRYGIAINGGEAIFTDGRFGQVGFVAAQKNLLFSQPRTISLTGVNINATFTYQHSKLGKTILTDNIYTTIEYSNLEPLPNAEEVWLFVQSGSIKLRVKAIATYGSTVSNESPTLAPQTNFNNIKQYLNRTINVSFNIKYVEEVIFSSANPDYLFSLNNCGLYFAAVIASPNYTTIRNTKDSLYIYFSRIVSGVAYAERFKYNKTAKTIQYDGFVFQNLPTMPTNFVVGSRTYNLRTQLPSILKVRESE